MTVKMPQDVADGLERIRETGRVNMLDHRAVQLVADELNEYGTVIWIEAYPHLLWRAVREGVEVEQEEEEA